MLTETPEIRVDGCACCGNDIFKGDEVFQIPLADYYFCSQQCTIDQMLKDDDLRRVVAE